MNLILGILPFLGLTLAFHTPNEEKEFRSGSLPYGRDFRAQLTGDISILDDPSDEWWQGLDRNNTMNCSCGLYSTITDFEQIKKWASEGVTSLHQYPWSVSLVSSEEKESYAFCGGSLISDRFVLTSAVCADGFQGGELDVLIGTWPKGHLEPRNLTEEVVEEATVIGSLNSTELIRKRVHRIIIHPKYTPNVLDNNIALLRLKGPVPTFGNEIGVGPVCLPDVTTSFDGFHASSLLWRFHNGDGYILPEKRTEVNSQILSKDECRRYHYNKEWGMLPDTMICSRMDIPSDLNGHPYSDSYDCPGDAGGMLLTEVKGRKVQVGIDSWTACYGRPRGVGVYTRLQEFMPWIKLHINDDGRLCAF